MQPRIFRSLNILGMEYVSPSKSHQVLQSYPGEIQNALIQIFDLSIRPRIPCKCGNAVDDQAKPFFACAQGLRGSLRRVEVQRVVHRQRHLVGDEREERDFLPAVCVGLQAAKSEASEASVYCRQRKRAYRANPAVPEHRGDRRESGLLVQRRNNQGLLMLVHPPAKRFLRSEYWRLEGSA